MAEEVTSGFTAMLAEFMSEIVYSPINVVLVAAIVILVYKIFRPREERKPPKAKEPELPRLKKQDFHLETLRKFDGTGSDGRLLVAVNGKVFDVTKGKRFYGPGGPYAGFAGRDASRGLATFSVETIKDTYDDLSDLNTMQMESVREWEMQFMEKYDFVGRLLKPGEEPTNYSDEEEDASQTDQKSESEQEKSKED